MSELNAMVGLVVIIDEGYIRAGGIEGGKGVEARTGEGERGCWFMEMRAGGADEYDDGYGSLVVLQSRHWLSIRRFCME